MPFAQEYVVPGPSQADVEALPGLSVLEFGTPWCGHCRRATPLIAEALGANPAIHHLRIEDGPNRRLGRRFGVKLWPTLVFLKDGKEFARVVRPLNAEAIRSAMKSEA